MGVCVRVFEFRVYLHLYDTCVRKWMLGYVCDVNCIYVCVCARTGVGVHIFSLVPVVYLGYCYVVAVQFWKHQGLVTSIDACKEISRLGHIH